MTPIERLQNMLNSLGLKAAEARLEGLLEQAAKKETSYAEFLDELLACEVDARRSRHLRARLQIAAANRRARRLSENAEDLHGVTRTVYEIHARSCHQICAARFERDEPPDANPEVSNAGDDHDDPSWPVGPA